jgi:DNA-binding transcriptional ArsR family regulator
LTIEDYAQGMTRSIEYAWIGICLREYIQPVNETFAVLAEPNRFRIVELLRSGPRIVNEIGERLHLNQPQVSKHLKLLKDAGFVEVQPRAQQRLYALRPEPLRDIRDWLERYRRLWDARFEQLDDIVEELKQKETKHEHRKRK